MKLPSMDGFSRAALAVSLVAGCSLPEDAAPIDAPTDAAVDAGLDAGPDPGGTNHRHVVSGVRLPSNGSEAIALGLDIDEKPNDANGGIDNQLGMVLANIGALAPSLDTQGATDDEVGHGRILLLVNVRADDLAADPNAPLTVLLGANPQPPPCTDANDMVCRRHLTGTGRFDVRADSPADPTLPGRIVAGRFIGGPGTITLQLALTPGATFDLPLQKARAELIGITATGIMTGKIGGAITRADLEMRVFPAIAAGIRMTFEQDCPLPRALPTCNCAAGSTGRTLQSTFDRMPTDCMITDAEVSGFIGGLVSPDIDLNGDGMADAVSVGVGVVAVAATFTPP